MTNKLTRNFYWVMSLLLGSAALFTACDDDDEGASSSTLQAGVFTGDDSNSYQLYSVGSTSFSYDDDGNLTKINDAEVSNNPFKITESDSWCTSVSNFRFNAQGYISNFDFSLEYSDESTVKGNYSLSYNSIGQVTKISGGESGVDYEDGDQCKWSSSAEFTMTYEDGNLISTKEVIKSKEDGESYSETDVITFTYGKTENIARQYTTGVLDDFDFVDDLYKLALIGYMGNASKYLPTKISYAATEDGETYSSSSTYSYTLGYQNLIASETRGNSRYSTYYSYWSVTKAEVAVPEELNATTQTEQIQPTKRHGVRRLRDRIK